MKFSFACAESFPFKSLSSCMCCSNSNLFPLNNETLRNLMVQYTNSFQLSEGTRGLLALN